MAQVFGIAANTSHKGGVNVEIDSHTKALASRDVQQRLQVLFGLIPLAPPVKNKGIDARPAGLVDLAGHRLRVG